MAIDGIREFDFRPEQINPSRNEPPKTGRSGGSGGPSFGEALEGALKATEAGMANADAAAKAYISGQGGDLHNVMIEMEQADIQFKTMLQVRNKLVDAYREIMRMQV